MWTELTRFVAHTESRFRQNRFDLRPILDIDLAYTEKSDLSLTLDLDLDRIELICSSYWI